MMSNKRKKKLLRISRAEKLERRQQRDLMRGMGKSSVLVDPSKIRSRSLLLDIPFCYQDYHFRCRDCGKPQVWTAGQQKWWYEEQGGDFETTAIRCRTCRRKERERKEEARRVHLEGLRRKEAAKADRVREQ